MKCLFPKERLIGDNGSYKTQGLFFEFKHQSENSDPIYTLKEDDYKKCLSMYKLYMNCESEYEAAQKLLGSWTHWKKLCAASWFKPYIEAWREEIKIREAAIGKATIIDQALQGNVAAAKELIHQVTKKPSPGRPSNKTVEDEKSKMQRVDQKVVSLLERMGHDV